METARGVEPRAYADLHEHLDRLDRAGLLYRIDAPVNKDTEMHPLVRWQFRGGIAEKDRKAFLFTNIVDSKGRRYDIPVVIGAYAGQCGNLSHRHERARAGRYRRGVGARHRPSDRAANRRDAGRATRW